MSLDYFLDVYRIELVSVTLATTYASNLKNITTDHIERQEAVLSINSRHLDVIKAASLEKQKTLKVNQLESSKNNLNVDLHVCNLSFAKTYKDILFEQGDLQIKFGQY